MTRVSVAGMFATATVTVEVTVTFEVVVEVTVTVRIWAAAWLQATKISIAFCRFSCASATSAISVASQLSVIGHSLGQGGTGSSWLEQ